jgi:branched-chain amino acid aminotransferase
MTRAAWIDGRFLAADEPGVSPFDAGLRGLGVFETLRSVGGQWPTLAEHVERMGWCALRLGLSQGRAPAWHEVAGALLLKAGLNDGVLRLFATRGSGQTPTHGATLLPLPERLEDLRQQGVRAGLSPFRRHADDPTAGLKLMSYAFSVLAREEAQARGLDEAVLLSPEGWVQEGAFSNVFCLRDGAVYTPTLTGHFLPGVTRALLLRALRAGGVRCLEKTLTPESFAGADAIWLTSGVWEVMPVAEWCGRPVGGVDQGLRMQSALRTWLARDLRSGRSGVV